MGDYSAGLVASSWRLPAIGDESPPLARERQDGRVSAPGEPTFIAPHPGVENRGSPPGTIFLPLRVGYGVGSYPRIVPPERTPQAFVLTWGPVAT